MRHPVKTVPRNFIQDPWIQVHFSSPKPADNHQWNTFAKPLPLEVFSVIAVYLSKAELAMCVRACKEWKSCFSPSLWETIHINSPEAFLLFVASAKEGSLIQNGAYIKSFTTHYFSIVDLLGTYIDACPNLTDLQVYSGDDPFEPRPRPVTSPSSQSRGIGGGFGQPAGNLTNAWSSSAQADTPEALPREATGQVATMGGTQRMRFGFEYQPPPPPKTLDLTDLTRLFQRILSLRKLRLHGRMFFKQKLSSISRLFNAIPTTVEDLIIAYALPPFYTPPNTGPEGTAADLEDAENSDCEEGAPLNITRIEFQISLLEDRILIPLLRRCSRLETLINSSQVSAISQEVCSALRQHCLQLTELRSSGGFTDEIISHLIDASVKGWKSIHLPFAIHFGPLSAEALLKHAPSLEVLRAYGCPGLSSPVIQKLLCTAQNLKRLEVLDKRASGRLSTELDAQDIIQSRWICDDLEVLKIKIIGIPRPDLLIRTNKRPLSGPLHKGGMENSHSLQRMVYCQLGEMIRLKELVLGSEDRGRNANHEEEEENEQEYFSPDHLQSWRQYECLSFTLESGLDHLRHLKSLKRLHLQGMAVGFGNAAEQLWAKDNLPELKYAYGDWNHEYRKANGYGDDQYFNVNPFLP
ncbi:hypothetical protein BGX26_009345 [Mortierella sp. AD094]|nr:hypothetical protein BGX26_009345 [Mortierella sp. AD094]